MIEHSLRLGPGRLYSAPVGTLPPTTRTVCLRYQEPVDAPKPGGPLLRFSCECGGQGCPHRPVPPPPWTEVGVLAPGSVTVGDLALPPVPHVNWDAMRASFASLGRAVQLTTLSFRQPPGFRGEQVRRVLFGPGAPRSRYLSRTRSEYRRRARARREG